MSFNTILAELSRLRHDYDSQMLLTTIAIDVTPEVKFSFGYNQGRNRRDLLELFPKTFELYVKKSIISITSVSSISNGNLLSFQYLRLRQRPDHSGKFYLDLRGPAMEKRFNRRLNDDDLDILFEFIDKRPGICGLHLAYNNLTNHGFSKLADFLANHKTVHYVNVMHNDITYLDQRRLAEDVSNWKVRCLNLRGNKIGQEGGEAMAYLLSRNSTIRHLALGETDQTVNSIISIADTLIQFGGNETLTKLDLTRTLVGTNAGELCRHLAGVLEVSRTLVELVLSKNDITDADLEIFLAGLKYENVLSRLNLSCNRISSHGAELIANILPQSDIKLLNLGTNMIGDTGAMALGRVFSFCKVTFLDISRNLIGDLGMVHLVWAICKPIDGFFIYGNKFTEHTARIIHAQILDLALDPKTLDIRFWFDEEGNIRYTRRNLWGYNEWYYFVHEWNEKYIIQHCCCPIRGGIMVQMKSDD